MNRWSKTNVIKTVKDRASFNARYLVKYVAIAKQHEYSTQEANDARRMANLYMHHVNEDIDLMYALGYIDAEQQSHMEDSVWEYFKKVYR